MILNLDKKFQLRHKNFPTIPISTISIIHSGNNGWFDELQIRIPWTKDNQPDFNAAKKFCRDLREQVTKLEREYWETQI